MKNKGFTLIELLIVVAIIAILAAIAVPNFLEAQVRAKVARVKSELRTLSVGLESYMVDGNHFPPSMGWGADDGSVNLDRSLFRLTTPIAYLSSVSMRDPFGVTTTFNWNTSHRPCYMYLNYEHLVAYDVGDYGKTRTDFEWGNIPEGHKAYCVKSCGPDHTDNDLIYCDTTWAWTKPETVGWCLAVYTDTIYDATNGTVSRGDIGRLGGAIKWCQALPIDK